MIERIIAKLPRGARAVAWLGILAGLLAFWVALPPLSIRSPIVPILIGVIGIALGVGALSRGVRRLAWGAVAIGLLGVALGYLATRSRPCSATRRRSRSRRWGVSSRSGRAS